MKNSDSKWRWMQGCVMLVLFLGIPVLAGGAFESGSVHDENKVKFKAKISLPQGEAVVKYKTWKTLNGVVQKKLVCEVEVAPASGTRSGDRSLCQVEVGGSFVTLAEGQVFPGDDREVEGKIVLRNEHIPEYEASFLVDGAPVRVVLNSTPPLTFQGILEEVGKRKVKLKADMGRSPLGKAKVRYESRVKTDGTSKGKLTCKVELELASGVNSGDQWSCYTVIDGSRNNFGVLTWETDEGDELEGKLVLQTTAGSIPALVEGTEVFIGDQATDQIHFRGILNRD